jgi:hypothetical protein
MESTTGRRPFSDTFFASIVSVHGSPLLSLEPLKILNFYFNEDPDSALHSNSDPDLVSQNNGVVGAGCVH